MKILSIKDCDFAWWGPGRSRTVPFGAVGFLLALSGCDGAHLYSAAKHQSAKTALETYSSVNLVSAIATERKNQVKVLESELSVINRYASVRRDIELVALFEDREWRSADPCPGPSAGGPELAPLSCKLSRKLDARDRVLSGAPHGSTAALASAVMQRFADERDKVQDSAETFAEGLLVAPDCPPRGAGTPELSEGALKTQGQTLSKAPRFAGFSEGQLNEYIQYERETHFGQCTRLRDAEAEVDSLGGEIGAARVAWIAASDDLAAGQKAAKAAEAKYKAAAKAYADEAKKHKEKPGDEARKALEKLAGHVKTAAAAVDKAGGVFGQELLAKDQLERIDLVLTAAAGGEIAEDKIAGTPGLAEALGIVSSFPGFADRALYIAHLAERPPVSGLIIEKDRLSTLHDDARAKVARKREEVALLKSTFDAKIEESRLIGRAIQDLNSAVRLKGGQITRDELTAPPDPAKPGQDRDARRLLVQSMSRYAATFVGPQRSVHENEYRGIAISHTAALDSSETALKLWNTLISTSLGNLNAYHEGGVKSGDVIQLLQALGLFAIATEVD